MFHGIKRVLSANFDLFEPKEQLALAIEAV